MPLIIIIWLILLFQNYIKLPALRSYAHSVFPWENDLRERFTPLLDTPESEVGYYYYYYFIYVKFI